MSDRYYPGSYAYTSESNNPTYTSNRGTYDNQYGKSGKDRQSYDIKESNISQQTIIHRARLYSPDRAYEQERSNFATAEMYGKTKAKKSQVKGKINQIVDLCENDRDAEIQEFKDVVGAEKKILNMFQQEHEYERQSVPNIDLSHFGDAYQDRGTTFGPIRNNNFEVQKIQSRQVTRREAVNNEKPTATRDNIYKKSAIDDLKTDRNLEEPASNLPAEIRQIAQQNRHLNDETEKMIEEIQRKAMEEIENLRSDKIELMRRLNAEIKAHNEEKRIRARLENELARLKGQPLPKRHSAEAEAHKNQQKYYSQPHFKESKPKSPPQNYYVPQPQPQQNYRPFRPQMHQQVPPQSYQSLPEPIQKNLQTLKHELHKLQQENNILMKTLRPNENYNAYNRQNQKAYEKQELRRQVYQLNELIGQYETQFRRQQFEASGDGAAQLQNLLQQGERIQLDTLRLLKKNQLQKNQISSIRFQNARLPNLAEDTTNFKRRLMETENQYQSRNGNMNSNNSLDAPGSKSYYQKQYISNQQNRMMEFERILSDMNNAAR